MVNQSLKLSQINHQCDSPHISIQRRIHFFGDSKAWKPP